MLVPSSMEAPPQLLPAAQPTVSAPPQEAPKPGNVKVGTGPGMKSPTADSYFPPDKDHPIGLVGNVADQFAAEMQAILGSGPNSATAAKATNATEANPEPKTLVGASSPGPGHALGRIEEHDAENASVSQDSRPSSVATKLTQSSQQPSTPQPQQLPPSQQSSPNNTPKPPQGFLPPLSGQPGVGSQGPRAGMPQPGQTTPGRMMPLSGPMGSQGPMPPQGLAPQQQWQGNMQRPPSVPPQLQMQPNKGKENKWTKWFKSSKPEKRPDAPQGGPLGSHPPQQYMPLQPGQPMQMRPPHGFPMQQMQPGGLGSPAPSQMMPVQSPSQGSAASSPQMGFQNQSQQQTASPMPHHLMPAPLSLRPKSEVPAGMPGGG
ncbi:hypothetical protein LMH87_007320 [Akanthomyces muscarius]|uniref:Uncharacterized protein n=1 Tax=Akanthomyces muscarius TaxID=2231603 RepID=A0A9W8UTX5_AKAMU|nr:hypothetical protein LMH87_007320 [Akanthomyces muscarius]KAJ4165698.1 hypothetical protein LMH87_007320 [Akanthomyces muscarius]